MQDPTTYLGVLLSPRLKVLPLAQSDQVVDAAAQDTCDDDAHAHAHVEHQVEATRCTNNDDNHDDYDDYDDHDDGDDSDDGDGE